MAKYQKYAEYKDSGVEWLGLVPKEWSLASIARVSNKITNGYVGATRDIFFESGVRYLQSLHIKKNKINFHTPYYVSEHWSNEKSKSILKEGDVLIVQTGDIGQVATVTKEFEGCNCHALIIVSGNEKISGFYLSWLLNSDYGRQTLKSIQTGALHPHLNCDAIKDIKITLPDIKTQKNISSFLDHETAKIDTLIAKQEKLIELLKEKRQAVISHAVTKGLNPNVAMKDSGVEWLGQVPEHWEVSRFKFVCSSIIAGPFGSSITKDMYVPKGYKVYGQEQVIPNDFEIGDYYISEKNYIELNRYAVYPKDILISCVGTFGKIAVFPENAEKGIINPRLIKATVSNKFNPYFFREYLKSDAVFKQFEQLSRGGTMGVINIGILNEIIAVIPPIKEQDDIYNFIQKQKYKFNNLINKAESAIQLMQERRTALISAAVTGKIDVRNWQYPNEAKTELSL